MALAPVQSRCHTVRRLAFTRPVREAGAAGHWITLHAEGSDEGTVHVYVGGGGYIEKGPASLVHQHIGQLASHPSVARTTRHPAGHEPEGARSHPQFIEAGPKPRPGPAPVEGGEGEPAKAPGKPYARLSGTEQGRRTQEVGKAIQEAQSQLPPGETPADLHAAAQRLFELGGGHAHPHERPPAPGESREQEAQRKLEALQLRPSTPNAERQAPNAIADTAVAHQQAQAELAAHRAAHDRNPNPWAPHLSPPVGDAKDRELAEKATRAQLAHQAAQAQQQGAQQAQQTAEQRAHEKEMVRVKAETAQAKPEQAHGKPQAAHQHQPSDSAELYKARNELAEAQHRWTRAKVEARTPAEHERVKLHQEMVRRLTGQVRDLEAKGQPAQPMQSEQSKKPAQAAYEALQAEVKRRQGDRPAEPTPRFSAPQPKEKPQTAPQPEQAAHPYEGEAHEHVAALPQAVRDTLTKAGVKVQQHQGSQAEALPGHGVSTPMAKLGPADAGYDSRTGTAHFFGGKAERYNVHHEMGHALDDALGYQTTGKHHTPYSSQPEFQALYRKHKENMDLPPPMRTNAQEMFADAFAMHHDVLHQEGETADGDPRMVHRGRKLERAAPDLHAHIAALSKHPPARKVRESANRAPRFSAPVAG